MPPSKSTDGFDEPGLRMSRLNGLYSPKIDPGDEMYLLHSKSADNSPYSSQIIHTFVDGRRCIHQVLADSATAH